MDGGEVSGLTISILASKLTYYSWKTSSIALQSCISELSLIEVHMENTELLRSLTSGQFKYTIKVDLMPLN